MSEYTRKPYSREAEHAVLGAMLSRPELIDVLSSDLLVGDFYYENNRAIYQAITGLHAEGVGIDAVTVADTMGDLPDGTPALLLCVELQKNATGFANASTYAGIIHERAIDRQIIEAAKVVHEVAHSSEATESKIAVAQAAILGIDGKSATPETVLAVDVLGDHMAELERRHALGGQMDGLATGLGDLDKLLNGLRGGQLGVVAGRPKMGKTTLAMQIARNAGLDLGEQTLVISLEMSNGALMDRMLAAEGSVPLGLIKSGEALNEYGDHLFVAANKIHKSKSLHLSDRRSLTMSRCRSMGRRHKMLHGLKLVVIDHIGLLDPEQPGMNEVQKTTEITRQAKLMAEELDCVVILLSQLNRELEKRPNKRPIPADLRNSGSIEQDCDWCLFVYRDEVYHPDTPHKGIAEIILAISRDSEPGTVYAGWQGQFNRFANLAAGYRPIDDDDHGKKNNRKSVIEEF